MSGTISEASFGRVLNGCRSPAQRSSDGSIAMGRSNGHVHEDARIKQEYFCRNAVLFLWLQQEMVGVGRISRIDCMR